MCMVQGLFSVVLWNFETHMLCVCARVRLDCVCVWFTYRTGFLNFLWQVSYTVYIYFPMCSWKYLCMKCFIKIMLKFGNSWPIFIVVCKVRQNSRHNIFGCYMHLNTQNFVVVSITKNRTNICNSYISMYTIKLLYPFFKNLLFFIVEHIWKWSELPSSVHAESVLQ